MFLQMIIDHIPRTWKAAGALVIIFVCLPESFARFTTILIGQAVLIDWLMGIGGLFVAIVAAYVFYSEQHIGSSYKSTDQVGVETLAEHEKQQKEKREIRAWHMNDTKRD